MSYRIEIHRLYQKKTCCLGELKLFKDKNEEAIFSCKTLEEDEEGTASNSDLRVPSGKYQCKWHWGSRFQNVLSRITNQEQPPLLIYNDSVSASRCILIHNGNTHKDTKGCILLGKAYGDDGESVIQSQPACKDFYLKLNRHNQNEIEVIITNDFDSNLEKENENATAD